MQPTILRASKKIDFAVKRKKIFLMYFLRKYPNKDWNWCYKGVVKSDIDFWTIGVFENPYIPLTRNSLKNVDPYNIDFHKLSQ